MIICEMGEFVDCDDPHIAKSIWGLNLFTAFKKNCTFIPFQFGAEMNWGGSAYWTYAKNGPSAFGTSGLGNG